MLPDATPGVSVFPGTSGSGARWQAPVGSTIGSGIFRVPASVADRLQDPGPVLLAWVLGGVIALFGALTLAEVRAMPRSGGVFAYILEAFGPLPAFLFGWSELAVIRASALGAIATIFAEYLGYVSIPLTPFQVRLIAAAGVVSVGLLNYLGVSRASVVMNLVTILKYGALAARLGLLAFSAGEGAGIISVRRGVAGRTYRSWAPR